MIDRFTKAQFENALPKHNKTDKPLWESAGLIDREYTYFILIPNTNKRIVVRSSVDASGVAADSGDDSIRLYLQYHYKNQWRPLKKLDAWTTRVPGWQDRMTTKLRELWQFALDDSRGHSTSFGANGKTVEKKEQKETEKPLAPKGVEMSPPSATPFKLGPAHDVVVEEAPVSPVPTDGPEPSEQQKAAIEAPTNAAVRVLAGPGAGKTFVVARRYAFLLASGAKPSEIVAVTFNKTMADELLSRIVKVNPSVIGTEAENQVCTIHALCYRLLRSEGDRRQVVKHWQVKRFSQEIIEDVWPYAEDRPGYKEVLAWIDSAKMKGLTTADDLKFFNNCIDRFGNRVGHKLHETRKRFDAKMRRENLLTFADMPLDIETKLNTDRTFREKWQVRYKWIIVDEGQDTSSQAMRILTTLAQPQNQFYIVGDTDQLLYRFAGATPEANLFEGFEERYPDGILVKLETNYRSTREIVKSQLILIGNNYADHGGPYDDKYLKVLKPRDNAPTGDPVTFSEYHGPESESAALVDSLIEDMANGSQPSDVFVGARTRAQLGYLEGPLVRAQIPFINIANPSGFWGSKHVQDVVGYLRLAHNEADDQAFQRVYNVASNWSVHPWGKYKGEYCHHRYLGKAFLDACGDSYKNVRQAVSRRRSFAPGVDDLVSFLQEIQVEMAAAESTSGIIEFIVDNCYKKYLLADEGDAAGDESENGKLEDLTTVADVARQFESVKEFIDYVAKAVKAAEDAKNKSWDGYVVLSTIHRLKGLERNTVYGVGLSEGFLNGPVPIPSGLLPHTFSMTQPPNNGVLPTGGMGRIEDERCAAFVLVSRAKERCHLSGVKSYRKASLGPSRFVYEMGLLGGNCSILPDASIEEVGNLDDGANNEE